MRTLEDISLYSLIPLLIEKCDIDYCYEPKYEQLQLHKDNGQYLVIVRKKDGMFYKKSSIGKFYKVSSLITVIGDYLDGTVCFS